MGDGGHFLLFRMFTDLWECIESWTLVSRSYVQAVPAPSASCVALYVHQRRTGRTKTPPNSRARTSTPSSAIWGGIMVGEGLGPRVCATHETTPLIQCCRGARKGLPWLGLGRRHACHTGRCPVCAFVVYVRVHCASLSLTCCFSAPEPRRAIVPAAGPTRALVLRSVDDDSVLATDDSEHLFTFSRPLAPGRLPRAAIWTDVGVTRTSNSVLRMPSNPAL